MDWISFTVGLLLGLIFGGSIALCSGLTRFMRECMTSMAGLKSGETLEITLVMGRNAGGDDGGEGGGQDTDQDAPLPGLKAVKQKWEDQ